MQSDSVIYARGLRKSYGSLEAVKGIDFEVNAGEVFGLLGPNGAGKTTTVEILEGLRPRSGWLRHRLVDLLLDLGRMEDAIRELDTLGEIQLSAGQKREAIETIERIVALEPRNVDEYRSLLAQLREGR